MDKVANKPDMLNASEWRDVNKQLGSDISQYDKYNADTDWFGALLRTGISQNHALSLSGGSSKSNYRASYTYLDRKGIARDNWMKRHSFRFQFQQRAINDRLRIGLTGAATLTDMQATFADYFIAAYNNVPVVPIYNEDGSYFTGNDNAYNQGNMVKAQDENYKLFKNNYFYGQGDVQFEVIEGLNVKANLYKSRYTSDYSQWESPDNALGGGAGNSLGDSSNGYAKRRNFVWDRDYRLYLTICPPYMVKKENGPSTADWKYTDNAQDREFIDLMATISGETYHRLPSSNFKGFTVQGQPHFKNMNWGQGWNASQMGFWVWKYYNTHTVATNANGVNTTDAPLFRIGEVMVNYAEAMCELNKFDQAAADKSINKLRARVNVAKMVVNDINDAFDPKRDPSVPALLWEVRRERRVELMGEGFHLDDLRRWKKGDYVNKQPLGAYVTGASAKNLKVTGGAGADEGYVYFFDTPLGWQEHYYLYPLPLKQLALNTNLEQNPVWTK